MQPKKPRRGAHIIFAAVLALAGCSGPAPPGPEAGSPAYAFDVAAPRPTPFAWAAYVVFPALGTDAGMPVFRPGRPRPSATKSTEPTPTPAPAASPSPRASAPRKETEAVSMSALTAQFSVSAKKYYNQYGFSSNRYKYTQEELIMLAVVIHLEARGESYKAKLAVGNVVMNRVLAPGYPGDTIREVVTAPNQFCYDRSVTPNDDCVRAARDVLKYETWVVPQNTYFFRATSSTSNWGSHTYYAHIDSGAFYLDSYSGRYNGKAIPARLFERVYKWPQYGCKPGTRVRKIQIMLRTLGYDVKADGYFGEETRREVVRFQKDCGLTADGVAGPDTLGALIRRYGISRYLKL
ncbi:MAG: cell wall hydrolase [Christensenellales bacterium]|jgi:spore germination cell wall hydrolase CwlJ-like protein